MTSAPPKVQLAPGLEISRVVIGLWQIADMEKDGRGLDLGALAGEMSAYAATGFDSFDMADHYGSAEDIAGRFNAASRGSPAQSPAPKLLTKWCPEPGPVSPEIARAAVTRALRRLQTARIDLMQFHWWMFQHPAWIDALKELAELRHEGLIGELGLTNFNTDHLRLAVAHGFPVVSNQICFSLLDRRAAGDMSEFCSASGVRLLAYGTLAGGLLTDKWHRRPAPAPHELTEWSTMKYMRFVHEIGGWPVLQSILDALAAIARRHEVSIANVATRWVLEQESVAAVILGARLGEAEHRGDNLRVFDFTLDRRDHDLLAAALSRAKPLPGDCGDEYRRPPYLTATGDLSHHIAQFPRVYIPQPMGERPGRLRLDSGSMWESLAGYSRAIRVGDRILVSGTTATHGSGEMIAPDDAGAQAVYILDKIQASIEALGGKLEDVVRTRIYLRNHRDWEVVARVHGRYLGQARPANTLIEISNLIGGYAVEIEAEAMLSREPPRAAT
jgi:aryl-alcohol dehydrogenase-like predicted oxidoreductase/enamine deaminase RidA (YjgF/YER057c/UK114 family)